MYGTAPPSVFLVFCNPGAGGDDALAHWYMEVHGPDALDNGSFHALHRYRALGDYEARFLAVWEGDYASMAEASAYITPRATQLRGAGRVTDDMTVMWATMEFRRPSAAPTPITDVGTLTLVRGDVPDHAPTGSTSRYGDLTFVEQADPPDVVVPRWAGIGKSGMPPHGPYRGVFREPTEPIDVEPLPPGTWVSHWEPVGSLVQ
ncbi:MAG TPA: hypothetical protein VGQ20_08325 [Acidimicrobiales bacterium]|nr:hypothetical protein [Acidimicrobiales bacterium]